MTPGRVSFTLLPAAFAPVNAAGATAGALRNSLYALILSALRISPVTVFGFRESKASSTVTGLSRYGFARETCSLPAASRETQALKSSMIRPSAETMLPVL